jgi:uncharacterized protein YndB with AHSA1/START domain
VFDAVYNPKKLSGCFTTDGASCSLDRGTTVTWDFHGFPEAFPVYVKQVIMNEMIVLEWDNNEGTKNLVEIKFEPLNTVSTLVKISESGWKNEDLKSLDTSYGNSFG